MSAAPLRPATAAIHTRQATTSARPISSPIFQSTAFASASSDELGRVAVEVATPDFYTRHGNPNHVEMADVVATLEGAETGLVFAPTWWPDECEWPLSRAGEEL